MAPIAFAEVERVALRYATPDQAVNQCSIACDQLIDELTAVGVHDVRRLRVSGLRDSSNAHPSFASAHIVLRIGTEVADVTWQQVDMRAEEPFKIYPSVAELLHDWERVRDDLTDLDLALGDRYEPCAARDALDVAIVLADGQ